MIKKNLQLLTYALFGVVCFAVFFGLQFPWKAFLPQVLRQAEAQLSPDRTLALEASNLKPYWFAGVSLYDLKAKKRGKLVFESPKVSARLRLLPLFSKEISLAWKTKAFGGTLSGVMGQKTPKFLGGFAPGNRAIGKIRFKDIHLNEIAALREQWGLPLQGVFDGHLEFDLAPQKINEARIEGEGVFKNTKLGPGSIQGFDVPFALRMDDNQKPASLKLRMVDGALQPALQFSNPESQFELKGAILPHPRWQQSRLDLQIQFGLSEEIKKQLPAALFDYVLKPAEGSDGRYTYQIVGTMQRPFANPNRT